MKCTNCNKELEGSSQKKFCSRNCAASHNNKLYPKRVCIVDCARQGCLNKRMSYRHSLCEEHWRDYKNNKGQDYRNATIGEYRSKISSEKHASWAHSHVRQFARAWLKDLTTKPCKNCGYDKHVELCHIKPLSSFEDSALLKEVNSRDNVINLCRNCHWEFDNGILKLDL